MAAPSYTTDLTDIALMETGDTFEEFTGYALGDNAALETDWYLQGNSCASDEANNKTGVGHSIGYDYGSVITFGTDECFFGWMQCQAGNAMDTYQNGGYRVLIGSSVSNFYGWKVGGSNFGRNPYGGWTNVAVDPTHATDYTGGTVGSPESFQHFATAFNLVSAIGKGRPINADAYRYGRGKIYIEDGEAADYGTFAGIATQNDSSSNRWGLFQEVSGGYLWKGLLSFGNTDSSPISACDFRDSNVAITIDNTPRTSSGFNRIEINHASSRVDWTAVNISGPSDPAPGESSVLSRGDLVVVDNADVNFDTCVFTDMGIFTYQSNSTIENTTYRRCNLVTTGGGTFSGCTFDSTNDATKAVTVSSPANAAKISNSEFISGGTGHGLEITGTAADFTFTNVTWTGYTAAGGSPENSEALYVNIASGTLNITISGGTTPTVRTAGATVNLIVGAVTVKVTATTTAGIAIENARVLLKAISASPEGAFPVEASVTIARTGSPETLAIVSHSTHGMSSNDYVAIDGANQPEYNGVKQITVIDSGSYSFVCDSSPLPVTPATGTITSTFVALYGLTDSNGEIETSRVYATAQPVTGWTRKSTTQPFYQEGILTGTISTSTGYDKSAVMVSDE